MRGELGLPYGVITFFDVKLDKNSDDIIKKELKNYNGLMDSEALLKIVINIAKKENILLDSIIINILIYVEQIKINFKKYNIIREDLHNIKGYNYYEYKRKRLIDEYCICKTYQIFTEYSKYIENLINDVNFNDIFETISNDDYDLSSIKKFL